MGIFNYIETINWITNSVNNIFKGTSLESHVEKATEYVNAANNLLNNAADNTKNWVSDTILDGTVGWFSGKYKLLSISLSDTFIEHFSPSLDTFNNWIGSSNILLIFRTMGLSFSIALFAFMLVAIFYGAIQLAEVKESPYQLVSRLAISLTCILASRKFTTALINVARIFWDLLIKNNNTSLKSLLLLVLFPETLGSSLTSDSALQSIIVMVCGIAFCIQFIKFVVEIAERYIISCLLAYCWPLASAFIVSKNTSTIFKRYFQMFVCSLIMILMSLLFFLLLASSVGSAHTSDMLSGNDSLIGWIFLFALIKAAQRIDSYFMSLGLSVAVTGGNLFDSIVGTTRAMGNIMGGFQNAGSLAGGLLTHAAINGAPNNIGLLKAGKTLSDIAHPIKNASTMGLGTMDLLNHAAKTGNVSNIMKNLTEKDIDGNLVNALKSGDKRMIQALNQGSLDFKIALANRAWGIGENGKLNGNDISDISFEKNGAIIKTSGENGGKNISSTYKLSSTPTTKAMAIYDDSSTGSKMYLSNLENGNKEGMKFEFDKVDTLNDSVGFDTESVLHDAGATDTLSYVSSYEMTENGANIYGIDYDNATIEEAINNLSENGSGPSRYWVADGSTISAEEAANEMYDGQLVSLTDIEDYIDGCQHRIDNYNAIDINQIEKDGSIASQYAEDYENLKYYEGMRNTLIRDELSHGAYESSEVLLGRLESAKDGNHKYYRAESVSGYGPIPTSENTNLDVDHIKNLSIFEGYKSVHVQHNLNNSHSIYGEDKNGIYHEFRADNMAYTNSKPNATSKTYRPKSSNIASCYYTEVYDGIKNNDPKKDATIKRQLVKLQNEKDYIDYTRMKSAD